MHFEPTAYAVQLQYMTNVEITKQSGSTWRYCCGRLASSRSSERLQKQYSVAAPDPLLLVQTLEIIYSVAVPDPLLLVLTLEIIYSVAVPDLLLLIQTQCQRSRSSDTLVPDPLAIIYRVGDQILFSLYRSQN